MPMAKSKKRDASTLNLYPLAFDEAVAGLRSTPPPPEQVERKVRAKRPARLRRAPHIELLYFAECPNYQDALSLLRDVLTAHGTAAPVELVAVESQAEAERQQFYGSPTIRIDGVDIVPPDPLARPALACRIYRTAQGTPTPIPPAEAIAAALHRL